MLDKALSLHQKGRLAEAATLYRKILKRDPRNADALHLLGMLESSQNPSAAIALIDRAIALAPNNPMVLSNRGTVLHDLKRFDEALASYDRALAIKPNFAEALHNRGKTLRELKRPKDAIHSYDFALTIRPDYANALIGRGVALQDLRRFHDALISFDRTLTFMPDNVDALTNCGNALRELRRFEEALGRYDRALSIKPDYFSALAGRALVLRDLKRFDEALASFDRALALQPDDASLFSVRLGSKMTVCDWSKLGDDFGRLTEMIVSGGNVSEPWFVLATPLSAALQKSCSEAYVRQTYPPSSHLPKLAGRFVHDRVRLGYFSADFRDHPVAHMTAAMFEAHDRARFEVIAFSFGPVKKDPMRTRLENAFDRFHEVGPMPDEDVALLARNLEIDIAVDLNGFTAYSRPGILAARTAPIQVNYLGYPGTLGADYIDYLIADRTLIPDEDRKHYTEKIVYLPDTYMPTDPTRLVAAAGASRDECGLPKSGFVFCCFNKTYKISPEIFDVWMRLLKQVDGSVLWLPKIDDVALRNLKSEANARSVNPDRLVFAGFLANREDHLARLRLADLFLDTLPYNAHATACDALWAGLPVLTCLGTTFAGRVAASLLNAVGMPELITENLGEYEARAMDLASHPETLLPLRQRLAVNRLTYPLFNSALFTRHIEAAYLDMWKRHQADLLPEHIHVLPETKAAV